ncbi:unnamed protein product [Rotaria sp. Silwood2]|nr:unnamed protein product [Rotaria sp. Silwood2]CAF2602825.1 unnamed protein product [Rotaria sp. Silwood2]CAF2828775.1 unnamed protein product [Rotaria sp. Silwood2]CAF2973284.1 unnamed protein product [Rotaria sp. Silwood2]CAF3874414.1 unnamed protein product [Rotaria sp. Silwood2]
MTTAARTKENGCEFSLFKTPLRNPLRTPLRNGMLSSATLNDLASYSNTNNKHLKFIATTSMNDLQMCSESITTPIRFNKNKFTTPVSTQRRRALGLVNHNSNRICRTSSIDDLSAINTFKEMDNNNNNNKYDESLALETSTSINTNILPEDDLPHNIISYQDTFDDLIPDDERIERIIRNRTNGVHLLNYFDGVENTIRCQSPVFTYLNVSTLLDMVDIHN